MYVCAIVVFPSWPYFVFSIMYVEKNKKKHTMNKKENIRIPL